MQCIFSVSFNQPFVIQQKQGIIYRRIMQLCTFGSKVCQLLFVSKSASRHPSQKQGMGSVQTYVKKSKSVCVGAICGYVQLCVCSVPTVTLVCDLLLLWFTVLTGLLSELMCYIPIFRNNSDTIFTLTVGSVKFQESRTR